MLILLNSASNRCSTSCGCRSGSTDAHHRSSELVAAKMTSKKSGSQEGKSWGGASPPGCCPPLSKPSQAACRYTSYGLEEGKVVNIGSQRCARSLVARVGYLGGGGKELKRKPAKLENINSYQPCCKAPWPLHTTYLSKTKKSARAPEAPTESESWRGDAGLLGCC